MQHRLGQPRLAVIGGRQGAFGLAKPVRLVVDHEVSAVDPQHHIQGARQVPFNDWTPNAPSESRWA